MSKIKGFILSNWSIFISIIFFLPPLILKDFYFHTDIARDFLLIYDIVYNKKLTLIGPRSGGIQGVFHGPLWLYINIPAFILGKGNPVFVLYFWFLISIVSLFVFKYIVKKITLKKNIAHLATLIFALYYANNFYNSFNPTGALVIFPIFLYFIYTYIKTRKVFHLAVAFFILGLIFQFQMAFAGPLIISTILLLLIKKTKISHFLSGIILLIPLSSFILFDLRHSFLQIKSVLFYLKESPSSSINWTKRINSMIDSVQLIPTNDTSLKLIFFILFITSIIYLIRKSKTKTFYQVLAFFFLSYWIITMPYKGTIQNYYYLPFYPLIALIYVAYIFEKLKKTKIIAILALIIVPFLYTIKHSQNFINNFSNKDSSSWQFNYQAIKTLFDKKQKFGIFFFSPDQYAYTQKYPFYYLNKQFNLGSLYKKLPITYVSVHPEIDDNPYIDYNHWKINKLKIKRPIDDISNYSNGFKIEEYRLTNDEQNIQTSSDIDLGLFFR